MRILRNGFFVAFVVAGIVASLSTLNAATQTTNDIEITDAFVQIVPHSTKSAAAFLTITNNTDQDIALLSAQSTISKNTELHQHIHQDNGVMQMVQVPQILIKSHSSTALAPGGYHIMFINLLKPLTQGQKVSLSLHFNNDTVIELEDIIIVQPTSHHTHH